MKIGASGSLPKFFKMSLHFFSLSGVAWADTFFSFPFAGVAGRDDSFSLPLIVTRGGAAADSGAGGDGFGGRSLVR